MWCKVYSFIFQRRIQNPVKHLRWIFLWQSLMTLSHVLKNVPLHALTRFSNAPLILEFQRCFCIISPWSNKFYVLYYICVIKNCFKSKFLVGPIIYPWRMYFWFFLPFSHFQDFKFTCCLGRFYHLEKFFVSLGSTQDKGHSRVQNRRQGGISEGEGGQKSN